MKKMLMAILTVMLVSCNTTSEYGNGELVLTHKDKENIIAYFSLPRYDDGTRWNKVYVMNPITKNFWWRAESDYIHISKAVNDALKNCGDGCYIFALNNEIVWENFSDKHELQQIAYNLKKTEKDTIDIKKFSQKPFELSSQQKYDYEQYLRDVDINRTDMFAVSADRKSSFRMSQDGRDPRNRFGLRDVVIRACNSISGNDDCVLYAIDNELQ